MKEKVLRLEIFQSAEKTKKVMSKMLILHWKIRALTKLVLPSGWMGMKERGLWKSFNDERITRKKWQDKDALVFPGVLSDL